MIYNVSVILSDVRKTLERNEAENGVLSQDADTLNIDQIIRQKILHAAEEILTIAPLRLIDHSVVGDLTAAIAGAPAVEPGDGDNGSDGPTPAEPAEEEASAEGSITNSMSVPDDFLRLYAIRYSDWNVPVREYVMDYDEAAMLASSQFAGVRPNPDRPLVVMRDDDGQSRKLLCYGQSSSSSVLLAKYIKFPAWSSTNLAFPKALYRALVYETAGLVEATYKNVQSAQMFFGLARGAMGIVEEERAKGKVQGS